MPYLQQFQHSWSKLSMLQLERPMSIVFRWLDSGLSDDEMYRIAGWMCSGREHNLRPVSIGLFPYEFIELCGDSSQLYFCRGQRKLHWMWTRILPEHRNQRMFLLIAKLYRDWYLRKLYGMRRRNVRQPNGWMWYDARELFQGCHWQRLCRLQPWILCRCQWILWFIGGELPCSQPIRKLYNMWTRILRWWKIRL